MFESNFPVDMNAISCVVLWNSFKRITQRFSAVERAQMFAGTAQRVYRIEP
jgi:predicted TIM-barrel fold metal-dependent hydrolase